MTDKKIKHLLPDFDGDSLQDEEFQDVLVELAERIPKYTYCLFCDGRARINAPIKNWCFCLEDDCNATYPIQ